MSRFKQPFYIFLMITIFMVSLPTLINAQGNHATVPVSKTTHKLERLTNDLDPHVLKLALKAYNHAQKKGLVKNHKLMVVDFSLASDQKRMWVFDLDKDTLDFDTYVTHGVNSGGLQATQFSNQNNSKQSSLGTYVTEGTYQGKNGLSLNLQGIDKGLNDNAFKRRIVIHGASYADSNVISKLGRLGMSWGCFAVSPKIVGDVINELQKGGVLFAYYPQRDLLKERYLA